MSSKNRVNPDHYKLAGRDRPGENVVRARPRAAGDKPKLRMPTPKPEVAASRRSLAFATPEEDRTRPPREEVERLPEAENLQTSNKAGLESTARKQERTRHYTDPMPQTTPVPGAFGKSGTLTETEEEMIDPEADADSDRNDFEAQRRRQNRRAKK